MFKENEILVVDITFGDNNLEYLARKYDDEFSSKVKFKNIDIFDYT